MVRRALGKVGGAGEEKKEKEKREGS